MKWAFTLKRHIKKHLHTFLCVGLALLLSLPVLSNANAEENRVYDLGSLNNASSLNKLNTTNHQLPSLSHFISSKLRAFSYHDSSNAMVGNLAGNFHVSPGGSATYDIPITLSPGTAGMSPQLSLHYDSSSQNGLLGMGFGLSGLTAITRANQNIAQNGQIHGIDFSNDDRFELNGEQLVATKGAYGADGSEYKTYIDSQTRIVSQGVQGSGPASFVVQTKGGQTAYYGTTTDSQILAQGKNTVNVYALAKIVDQAGNDIRYHYLQDAANGSYYPSEIDYTGNDKISPALAPYNSVKFIYEDRPDSITSYTKGSLFKITKRLKEIDVYQGQTLVYAYKLVYEQSPNTQRSRIVSIQQCDGLNECFKPLIFTWQTNEMGWVKADPKWNPPYQMVTLPHSTGDDTQSFNVQIGDVDGSGHPVMLSARKDFHCNDDSTFSDPSNSEASAYRADPNLGWVQDSTYATPMVATNYYLSEHFFEDDCDRRTYNKVFGGGYGSLLLDLNGSGKADFIQSYEDGPGWAYMGHAAAINKVLSFNSQTKQWQNETTVLPDYYKRDTSNVIYGLPDGINGNFVDLEGVGREDFIVNYLAYNGFAKDMPALMNNVYINTPTGWQQSNGYKLPNYFYQILSHDNIQDEGMRFAHLTSSGLPDLLIANTTVHQAYINTGKDSVHGGASWQPASFSVPEEFRFSIYMKHSLPYATEDGGGRQVSLLGDGLDDLVQARNGEEYSWFNTGDGFIQAPSSYNLPVDIAIDHDGTKSYDTGVVFVDVTGSGVPALLQCSGAINSGNCRAWLNENGGWVRDDDYAPPTSITDNEGHSYGVEFVDLLGTGFPDVIVNNGKTVGTWLNKAQIKPDMIIGIQDALGDHLQVQYKPLTDSSVYSKGNSATYPNVDFNGPMWVVSQTDSDANVTPIPAIKGIDTQIAKLVKVDQKTHTTQYHYADAVYNHLGYGFLGFGQMTSMDQSTGISVTTTYSQDITNHTMGLASGSTTTLSNGTIINQQSSSFDIKVFGSGNVNETTYLPYVKQTVEKAYDLSGNLLSTKTTSTQIDDYNNPTDILQTSQDSSGTYTTDTQNSYLNHTDNNQWLLGELTAAKVIASAPNVPSVTRSTSYTYDAQSGLLASSTSYFDNASTLTKTYIRDPYGNIIETDTTGTGINSRSDKVTYDAQGRFIIQKTNALNQIINYEVDPRFGVVIKTTDPNGLVETNSLDGFGRVIKTIHPDQTESTMLYQWSSVDSSAPAGSVYEVIENDTNAPEKISYHDELDREIAQAMQGWQGKWIWQLTNYNELGLVISKTTPFFSGDPVYLTTNQYDVLGRVIQTINPDQTIIKQIYNGYSTTTVNPNNQQTTRITNVRGDLIESVDAQNHHTTYQYDAFSHLIKMTDSQNNMTSMQYDTAGNKIGIQDPDRGHWSYQYNVLGELVSQTDPLNQTTIFNYDLLGRMIARTDLANTANQTVSSWEYDTADHGVGKLSKENGVSGIAISNTANLKNSTHDIKLNILPANEAQKLAAAKNNVINYQKSFSYDELGRPTTVSTTLNGQTYTESTSYDVNSRPLIITYPNQVAIKNNYDNLGFILSVTDANSGALYSQINNRNANGQVTSVTHSNGLITTYTYDPKSNFLQNINTEASSTLQDQQQLFPAFTHKSIQGWHLRNSSTNSASTSLPPLKKEGRGGFYTKAQDLITPIQSLNYTYDNLGNVLTKKDSVINLEDDYQYDELNRLTQDVSQAISQRGIKNDLSQTLNYSYDALGNIINKSDVGNYHYGNSAGPHAVTSIDGGNETDTFQYDAAGNQTSSIEQTQNGTLTRNISYTSFDVPKQITQSNNQTNSNASVNFYYDANRNRFMRVDEITAPAQANGAGDLTTTTTTTLYLDNYEIDTINDGTTTHTSTKNYIGDTELVNDDQGHTNRYDILKDNIGSISVITDEQGNVVQRFHYDPFGEQTLVQTSTKVTNNTAVIPAGQSKAGIQRETLGDSSQNTSITRYGFTGQEEVQTGGIDLIHMNGRMYDPHLGRFLSADPDIQDPSNSQSLNRYTYCLNNPIAYTDPSGFNFFSSLWKSIKHLFKNKIVGELIVIVACAIAVCTLGGGAPVTAWIIFEHFAAAAMVSGAVTYAQTGSVGAALESAGFTLLTEYAWMATGAGLGGNAWEQSHWIQASLAHGAVGGDLSVLEGGSFKDGFLSAAVAQAASGPISRIDGGSQNFGAIMQRGAAAGMVGGTVSAATGGSFENGAATAAFAEMFNDDLDREGNPLSKMINSLKTKVSDWWSNGGGDYVEGSINAVAPEEGAAVEGAEDVGKVTNKAIDESEKIYDRLYSEHALSRMETRGVPPSAVEDTIANGISNSDSIPGRIQYHTPGGGADGYPGLTVITDSQSGKVITVIKKGGNWKP